VTTTSDIWLLAGTLRLINSKDKCCDILVAAEALAKKPARVIPTWIVAKNLLGSSRSFKSNSAFLSPVPARWDIFDLFIDTIAISDAAKKALNKTSISISRSWSIMLSDSPFNCNSPLSSSCIKFSMPHNENVKQGQRADKPVHGFGEVRYKKVFYLPDIYDIIKVGLIMILCLYLFVECKVV
jgi:hypothetical protein